MQNPINNKYLENLAVKVADAIKTEGWVVFGIKPLHTESE